MVDPCFDPDQTVKQALQLDKGKDTLIDAANTLALCNEQKQAAEALSALEKRYPQDTLIHEQRVPQDRAWLAIKAGDAQGALALLERVRAHDAASYAPYLRGLAYLQLKDSHNAIDSFQNATHLKGRAYINFSPYALSYLGLGRAYALAGNKPDAKKPTTPSSPSGRTPTLTGLSLPRPKRNMANLDRNSDRTLPYVHSGINQLRTPLTGK